MIIENLNRAFALHKEGCLQTAKDIYREILEIEPANFDALQLLGAIAIQEKDWVLGLDYCEKSLRINSKSPVLLCNLGITLKALNRFIEALDFYDKTIELQPDYAEAYYNRGIVLFELNRYDEAVSSYINAISLKNDYVEAIYNLGTVQNELMLTEDAIINYEKAIALQSEHIRAHQSKSLLLLLLGRFDEGLPEYEWRWLSDEINNSVSASAFKNKLWSGNELLKNKTIFLWSEQGLGDTIQFCRYATLIKSQGAKVILGVEKSLINLFSGLEGYDLIMNKKDFIPAFDYQCPLTSLPLAFKMTLETIPNQVPYLNLNINKQLFWRNHIGEHGFKIAICWQGSTHAVDKGRSFPVSLFEGLAKIAGVRLISLQKNEGVEQLDTLPAGMRVERLPEGFDNGENAFLDSAAVMKCVDLVITSDTALTHLAGALGVKTWLPLKYVPDWRWMLNRNDSPWYPNHQLFRQTTRDEWTSVFAEMENEVKIILDNKISLYC